MSRPDSRQSRPGCSHELTIARAKALSHAMLRQVCETEAAVTAGEQRREQSMKHALQNRIDLFQARIAENLELVRVLGDCACRTEHATKSAGELCTRLQHACYESLSALRVCEQRLGLRDSRPLEELVRDDAQKALESERKILNSARLEFVKLEREVGIYLDQLKSEHAALVKNIGVKKLDVDACRAAVVGARRPHSAPAAASQRAQMLRRLPNEASVETSKVLCVHAPRLNKEFEQLHARGEAVLDRLRRKCGQASSRSAMKLSQRSMDAASAERRLRHEASEVDNVISRAERAFGTLQKTTHKQDSRDMLRLDAEYTAEVLLDDLKLVRNNLQKQVRQKTALAGIDGSCCKVTPRVASAMALHSARERCFLPKLVNRPRAASAPKLPRVLAKPLVPMLALGSMQSLRVNHVTKSETQRPFAIGKSRCDISCA